MKPGVILVLSGQSGAGKDTVSQLISAQSPFRRFPTVTTRSPRNGERDGIDYHFVTPEAFSELLSRGDIFDPVGVHDRYGIPLPALRSAIARGERVILHLAEPSARRMRHEFPDVTVLVNLHAPSIAEARTRLIARGMTNEEIDRRHANDPQDNGQTAWDLIVENGPRGPEEAVTKILQFMTSRS